MLTAHTSIQMQNVGSEWVRVRQVTKFGHSMLDL